jgi:hypothetical protein
VPRLSGTAGTMVAARRSRNSAQVQRGVPHCEQATTASLRIGPVSVAERAWQMGHLITCVGKPEDMVVLWDPWGPHSL